MSARASLFVALSLVWSCKVAAVPGAPVQPAPAPAPVASKPPPAPVQLEGAAWVEANFDKVEVRIPMRDGKTLFTSIYAPKQIDTGEGLTQYPILLKRTPYSVGPYGADQFPERLGPSEALMRSGYIFVYQDVRGRFMSEGEFVNMRPHIDDKTVAGDSNEIDPSKIDEASDTYDTIEWLVNNVANNNGKVGMWGISYPGFYAAAGMIDAHPALAAVSPQAPIADWYFDDFHHHGAFFLPHAFNFLAVFGRVRKELETEWGPRFDHKTPDGYAFFKRMGPLANANERYLKHEIPFWDEVIAHPDRDAYWQARDILPHLNRVAPAVMTVGGLFDAEDLYGPFHIYAETEKRNPDVFNVLVMGPWRHGGWARTDGDRLGNVSFGEMTAPWYQTQVEKPFFDHFLKGEGQHNLPEALVFETGKNQWRRFEQWPPKTQEARFYFREAGVDRGGLSPKAPTERKAYDRFVSDPDKPVPYTEVATTGMTKEYMTDDQRFAARRPDVLVYESEVLTRPVTMAGELTAELWVSTSQRDADWVVKVIDVFPDDTPTPEEGVREGVALGGYQMMVRSEVIRGRYRDDYAKPKPFTPNKATKVELPLQGVLHTFEPGHKIMIQVQSTWFPLVDLNPQSWVPNIFEAKAEDFVSAEHRVYRDAKHPSAIKFGWLE